MLEMEERLERIPTLSQRNGELDARLFNLWRRARMRWGKTQRIALTDLDATNLILTDSYWVCVDPKQNDMPIVAWVDIPAQRDALHMPIQCKINSYHFTASMLREPSLELMEKILSTKLSSVSTAQKKVKSAKLVSLHS